MGVDMRQLGLDNKRKAKHETADAVIWTYAEGSLSHQKDGLAFTLSSCDTLALANLLSAHYDEIVKEARKEQRHTEDMNPKGGARYGAHMRKKKS